MERRNVKWHRMTAEDAVAQLHTNAACGLSRKAARSRYRKFGPNTLFDRSKRGYRDIWKSVLCDPSVMLLLFSMLLVCFFASFRTAIETTLVLIVVFVIAFCLTRKIVVMEETVSLYHVPTVYVLRDGKVFEISARYIVPGDILFLQKGDVVPCDCRLLECDGDALTRFYYRDGMGRQTALDQIKHAKTVYPYESNVSAPHCENILYGKSELLQGNVRALAIETGAYSYMGAIDTSQSKRSDPEALKRYFPSISPYLRGYSLILFLLIAPLTVLGLIFSPQSYGIMRVFLPICVLCGVGAQSLLLLGFRIIFADGFGQCVRKGADHQTRSIPKSSIALEKLAGITDVVVLGRSATSDGFMHLHRVALGDGEVSLIGQAQPVLDTLCEAYELLFSSPSTGFSVSSGSGSTLRDFEDPNLRAELQRISQYDAESLPIKLQSSTVRETTEGIALDATMRNGSVCYCFTENANILYACTGYEKNKKLYPFETEQRANLFRFIESSQREAGRAVIVTRQIGNRTVLIGIISCREEMQDFLPSVVEELAQCGIRVSFFLPSEDVSTLDYVNASKMSGAVLCASALKSEVDFAKYYGKYRVYCGFGAKQIRAGLHALKQQGCRFAVLGNDLEVQSLQSEAELRLACDPLQRDQKKSNGELRMSLPNERSFVGEQYSRSLSNRAHLLLPCASQRGGGLHSLLHAVTVSYSIAHRMHLFLRYLIFSHSLRTSCIALSAVLGAGLLTGAQTIYCGLLVDFVALCWIMSVFIPQDLLRNHTGSRDVKSFFNLRTILPPVVTGGVLAFYTFVFYRVNIFSADDAVSFLFVTLVIVLVIGLCKTMYTSGVKFDWRVDLIPLVCILVPVILLVMISLVAPSISIAFDISMPSLIGGLSLLVGPVVYLGVDQIMYLIKKR